MPLMIRLNRNLRTVESYRGAHVMPWRWTRQSDTEQPTAAADTGGSVVRPVAARFRSGAGPAPLALVSPQTIDFVSAVVGEIPNVDASRAGPGRKSSVSKTASGTAELPRVGTEQLGEIGIADPRSPSDLSEHPSWERPRFEAAALVGQAVAIELRSGGIASLPERFDDHVPLGFDRLAAGDHGQTLFQRRQLSHRSCIEGTAQRHQLPSDHASHVAASGPRCHIARMHPAGGHCQPYGNYCRACV